MATSLRIIVWLLGYFIVEPVLGIVVNNSTVKQISTHCVVVLDNSPIRKTVGSVWLSSEDPCLVHACEVDDTTGNVRETISRKDCGQFYCDVDSELRAINGTCCGECVRNKCLYKENYYVAGETWRDTDECLLLECAQPIEGDPVLNIYRKTCPALPRNCPPAYIYTKDCCQYCRYENSTANDINEKTKGRVSFIEGEDTWTEEYYRNHPCARECQIGAEPMTCNYRFVIEWYQSLSKACYDCPRNSSDCERTHCITADGVSRSITVANRMMPGPSIEVCENDLVVVDVHNDMLGDTTSIHWHGMHMKDNPYMDGVPHVTQCPITPHSTFRYAFKAEMSGTHFWHSHTGMQRGDGLFGALIVRRPRLADPHAHLYDFDLSEHKLILQDWLHEAGVMVFTSHHHSTGDNKPRNLLVNGRGRYYPGIWEAAKRELKLAQAKAKEIEIQKLANEKRAVNSSSTEVENNKNSSHILTENEIISNNNKNITRLARLVQKNTSEIYDIKEKQLKLAETESESTTQENIETTTTERQSEAKDAGHIQSIVKPEEIVKNRHRRETIDLDLDKVPHQIYKVKKGYRYRFRIINGEYLNCPIAVSIDKHSLTVINSDGYDLQPVQAGSVVTYSGERWDFVLNANQSVDNYWVRLKGLMDCSDRFTSAFQVAILRYEGAPEQEPAGTLGWSHEAEGIEVNVMNRGSGFENSLTAAELRALPYYDTVPGVDTDVLKTEPDYKFFIYYDFYPKDNPIFHIKEYYSFNESMGLTNKVFTPQLNHISLKFPSSTLLSQRDSFDEKMFCNESSLAAQGIDCQQQFCYCHHVLQVPLNSIVEVIFVDEGLAYDANHPFHLHGNAFRVVGLERLGSNVTIDTVKQLDGFGLLKRNLINPPVKDTVTVPDGGYTIIRFKAYNPGYWLMHCHIEFHAEIGMAVVFKVGENDEMVAVPKNFPTCADYMPDIKSLDQSDSGVADKSCCSSLLITICLVLLSYWFYPNW